MAGVIQEICNLSYRLHGTCFLKMALLGLGLYQGFIVSYLPKAPIKACFSMHE